ncbi:hypothetical protein GCM10023262_07200 [Bartonella pachyuromydis]|uniref:Uncharacterized protein n=1 Tax=Bartonella pachyuromydis TaxID=931097 RepID=A0ABP8VHX7_9HYPH
MYTMQFSNIGVLWSRAPKLISPRIETFKQKYFSSVQPANLNFFLKSPHLAYKDKYRGQRLFIFAFQRSIAKK